MSKKINNEHGGNLRKLADLAGCTEQQIIDFSSNINPSGTPQYVAGALNRSFGALRNYPEPYAEQLIEVAAGSLNIPVDRILFGNGSNQLIHLIPRALPDVKRAVLVSPGYLEYETSCLRAGLEIVCHELNHEDDFRLDQEALGAVLRPGDLVFIGNPVNPTGSACRLEELAAGYPETFFVVDEAFIDYCEELTLLPDVPENVIVLRSLTKFYAIPGLRLGYCVASPRIIAALKLLQPCWSLSSPAIETGIRIFQDTSSFKPDSCRQMTQLKDGLIKGLEVIGGIKVYPSYANYLLLKTAGLDANRFLKQYKIALRSCAGYRGLDASFFRIAVKTEDENNQLLQALDRELNSSSSFYVSRKRKTPSLMLQGTCSNAGKSMLATAFCRILLQDGYAVAPFKAQNMALNSYVTAAGGEMGRAQVVQAEACRLDPDVRMNPVLLKPSGKSGSQVIFMGEPVGMMSVRQYAAYKRELWENVKRVYDSLAADYQAVILEGAGSPGEVNLKQGDIVNMNMAAYAESPVLLAGDIDRGGVYASFIGTFATFSQWERDLLHGFIVNKFRGDASLLGSAHDYVEGFTGKPVLGVVPHLGSLGLPEEDSVSFEFNRREDKLDKPLDAVVISLGHIANFTDFAPLEIEPDITLRKVNAPEQLGNPDIIIMPGTKNTISDMVKLRESGLADSIVNCVRRGAWYIGICGGLQIAGGSIADPWCVESEITGVRGLDLLPLDTVMERNKQLTRTTGTLIPGGDTVSGYEIHHGITTCRNPGAVAIRDTDGREIGYAEGRVWCAYLHGVFDDDRFRRKFINTIRLGQGLTPLNGITAQYNTEDAINKLAEHVRAAVDMAGIYRIMGLK